MTPLAQKVAEFGIRRFASELGLDPINVRHYIKKRYKKIGRATRSIIRKGLIERGWLVAPKPRPKHHCPSCGKLHVQNSHPRNVAQP